MFPVATYRNHCEDDVDHSSYNGGVGGLGHAGMPEEPRGKIEQLRRRKESMRSNFLLLVNKVIGLVIHDKVRVYVGMEE